MLVLLPNGEASNTKIVGNVVDDQRAEAGVNSKGDSQGEIDEDRRVVHGRLDDRGSEK